MPVNGDLEKVDSQTVKSSELKKYSKPAILHEVELEAQAGSPMNIDPYGLNPNQ